MKCEGYRRYGGAFTLGPVRWVQCSNEATVMLKVRQDEETQTLPACQTCWEEVLQNKIKVLEAAPIPVKKSA